MLVILRGIGVIITIIIVGRKNKEEIILIMVMGIIRITKVIVMRVVIINIKQVTIAIAITITRIHPKSTPITNQV